MIYLHLFHSVVSVFKDMYQWSCVPACRVNGLFTFTKVSIRSFFQTFIQSERGPREINLSNCIAVARNMSTGLRYVQDFRFFCLTGLFSGDYSSLGRVVNGLQLKQKFCRPGALPVTKQSQNIGATHTHISFRTTSYYLFISLGRLPKVDLIILKGENVRPSVRPSVRPQRVSSI